MNSSVGSLDRSIEIPASVVRRWCTFLSNVTIISWVYVDISEHEPGMPVILVSWTTASINDSFLGVQLSECQKCVAKTSQNAFDIHPELDDSTFVPWIDLTAHSSYPLTGPRLQSTDTKSLPTCDCKSSLLTFSSVILAPSSVILHSRFISLLICSSIFSFVIVCSLETGVEYAFVPLHVLSFPHSTQHHAPFVVSLEPRSDDSCPPPLWCEWCGPIRTKTRRPNKETAKIWPTAQASIHLHRLVQAHWKLTRDGLLPWQTVTRTARSLETICLPLPLRGRPDACDLVGQRAPGNDDERPRVSRLNPDTSVLSIANCSPWKQKQPVGQNLHPTLIDLSGGNYVHVLDTDIRGDPHTRFVTHASPSRPNSKPATLQNPRHSTCCAAVVTEIDWTTTPANTTGKRKNEPQTAENQETKDFGQASCRNNGSHVKRALANALCERNWTRARSDNLDCIVTCRRPHLEIEESQSSNMTFGRSSMVRSS